MNKSRKVIVISNEIIEAGEQKLIKIPVGHLPSGTKLYTHVHVKRAKLPGPTVVLIGGMHGDEINGTEIVRRALEIYKKKDLTKGTLITIPLLNVYGFIRFTRDVSDGKDVNRSFPGSPKGSLASRIAHILHKEILPHADMLIDFHTGGEQRYNFPQVRYSRGDDKSKELATIFNTPYRIESKLRPNSLRQFAGKFKLPNLAFEGGESSRFDGFSIEKALQGINNILVHFEMLDGTKISSSDRSVLVTDDKWIRASISGIFVWNRSSGVYIQKGEILGIISDPDNLKAEYVKAKYSGHIIGHNNAPVVHIGDALFHIGME